MFSGSMLRTRLMVIIGLICVIGVLGSVPASAQTHTYTLDADFDEGALINVNHDSPDNDQLQLNKEVKPFPFINIAASGKGTVVRINTITGEVLGEFWSSPSGMGKNPSRTTVDQFGNVWVANRDESSGGKGSVTRIGLVIGGTRCDADGTPNPGGQYLKPPFDYSTAVDRDFDGLIKTSYGLGNVLPWTNAGNADAAGGVTTAEDECIINYTRVNGTGTRTVAVDGNNDVWVGGTGNRWHEKLDGNTGQPIPGTQVIASCGGDYGGYGGLVDGNGFLWSARNLWKYDPATSAECCIPISNSYGLAEDLDGNIWNSQWTNCTITKLRPDCSIIATYSSGGCGSRGVAVTPADGNIWIANSTSNTVTRLRASDGVLLATVPVGNHPTGVAVDAAGKVWVTNYYSHNTMRIDPATNSVDLTVGLGSSAYPYNYSDMTGVVALSSRHGSWTVVYDGGRTGIPWQQVLWTCLEPDDTGLTVQVRAADLPTDLPGETFQTIGNGDVLSGIVGQFIEARVLFDREPGIEESPILYDLTIRAVEDVFVDIKPQSCPNPLNVKKTGDERDDNGLAKIIVDGTREDHDIGDDRAPVLPVAILGTDEFDVRDVDPATVTLEGVPPIRYNYEDVSTPIGEDAGECECTTAGHDGFMDLTLKFDKNSIVAALGPVNDGDVIPLTLTGETYDGILIEGVDCVIIRGRYQATTSTSSDNELGFSLDGNFPNPFNPMTNICFTLPVECDVTLEIYNVLGQKIATLIDDTRQAGRHTAVWNSESAASGVYFYRLTAGVWTETRKMLLLR